MYYSNILLSFKLLTTHIRLVVLPFANNYLFLLSYIDYLNRIHLTTRDE